MGRRGKEWEGGGRSGKEEPRSRGAEEAEEAEEAGEQRSGGSGGAGGKGAGKTF
ncbi:MAG: hypothetical protein F6J93_36685 [Oscillatoria sp. SIO1A7]|nr:hypothetical protein [Oscillatoria sp. SIO1A7]